MTPRTYQRRIASLLQILAAVEWVQPTYNGSPSCSYCGAQQHWGHATDCELNATLRAAKFETDPRAGTEPQMQVIAR